MLLRDQIIETALERIRIGVDGEPLTADMVNKAARWLNLMIGQWRTDGLNMWRKTSATLFLVSGQSAYLLGSSSADHATSSFAETTLAEDAAESAVAVEVASADGISDGDDIGVLIDSDFHWTTVDGAPAGTTVTIADALPSDVAAGAVIVAYTEKIERPLHVLDARRRTAAGQEVMIDVKARLDYLELPDKSASGPVNTVYYDKQLDDGVLHVWPVSDGRERLLMTVARPIATLDDMEATPDFPEEWELALVLNLADLLAPTYGFDDAKLADQAMRAKAIVESFDREDGPVQFEPDMQSG